MYTEEQLKAFLQQDSLAEKTLEPTPDAGSAGTKKFPRIDSTLITGYVFAIISFLFVSMPFFMTESDSVHFESLFLLNYGIAVAYLILVSLNGGLRRGRRNIFHMGILLVLGFISCYGLNREIPLFHESANWFVALEVLISVNLLSFVFFERMKRPLRLLVTGIAGMGMFIFIYLSFYLCPTYGIGLLALPALGFSIHCFVPLLLCFYTTHAIVHINTEEKNYWRPFATGLIGALLFTVGYGVNWNSQLKKINSVYQSASNDSARSMPAWMAVAQRVPAGSIEKKMLKSGIEYAVPSRNGFDNFLDLPGRNFDKIIHDPLVLISTLFSGDVNIPIEDRVKILQAVYDSRHEAEERLWSGRNLKTSGVSTDVEVWPAHRVAYTEMELTVSHIDDRKNWRSEQEAIYSFYLPEGGVVSSLSLWINGKEEKGILTTKAKADSAYKTIVGREMRDPSVVHWKEGNRVTVRVFPVLSGESRKFKIGVSSPLLYRNNRLVYNSIWFDGPAAGDADENIRFHSAGKLDITGMPVSFAETRSQGSNELVANSWSSVRTDQSDHWSVSFAAPALSGDAFRFNDRVYKVVPSTVQISNDPISEVYLDINSSWSAEDFVRVYELAKHKKLFAVDADCVINPVNELNRNAIFEKLHSYNFSLFPFHILQKPANTLVIIKSKRNSPSLAELKDSELQSNLDKFFSTNRSTKLFNMGDEISPYLQSLQDFRLVKTRYGSYNDLKSMLQDAGNSELVETDEQINLLSPGVSLMKIESKGETSVHQTADPVQTIESTSKQSAPDHLMRLFAYNHILHNAGAAVFHENHADEIISRESAEANIVTPFSSLIVLETQKDYDRFDIKSSKDSLQNAAANSNGAVPEPHEWALIILVLGFITWFKFRHRFSFTK